MPGCAIVAKTVAEDDAQPFRSMRTAATPARTSSTHHKWDIPKRWSRWVASAKRSSDLEIDRGLFSPIALDRTQRLRCGRTRPPPPEGWM